MFAGDFWFLALLAIIPALFMTAITWRLIWPPWKRKIEVVLHPAAYVLLVLLLGRWGVALAWLHQGLGLVFHIVFSRRYGFRWYAVDDPDRYRELSRSMVGAAPDDA